MIKKSLFGIICIVIALSLWVVFNPKDQFGLSFFAFTTFNKIPYIYSDIEVDINGVTTRVDKTHIINHEILKNILIKKPNILILSTGWDGSMMEIIGVRSIQGVEIIIKKNKEAKKLYNKFRKEGKSVAIHYHSTC